MTTARQMIAASIVAVIVSCTMEAAAAELRYRDWTVGTTVMIAQSALDDRARVYSLGEVAGGTFQAAMLISEDRGAEDSGTKNAVLFECGMHGREWYAAEACYWLIDYLLRSGDSPLVRELLTKVNVWVIPQSNPGGRQIDDLMFGDPGRFASVCTRGRSSALGQPCTATGDCGSNGYCSTLGWRANANTTSCGLGVDPARNFSSGWNDAAPNCADEDMERCGEGGADCSGNSSICTAAAPCARTVMKYRGAAPFSELETLNLRRFVHNHMVSMAAILHTNAQQISNRWYDSGHRASVFMTDRLIDSNAAGSASFLTAYHLPASADPSLDLHRTVGRGHGQFSAWLTSPADAVLPGGGVELDFGTERNISTFYFELPIDPDLYDGYPYQNAAGDGSNSYHPSGQSMRTLWNQAIRDVLRQVIVQARAPQCPTDRNILPVFAQCETRDFGLVGAKIAAATDEPGLLDYDAGTREEVAAMGLHQVVFAVQNFSRADSGTAPTQTTATVIIERGPTEVARMPVPVTLDPGARGTYAVEHQFLAGSRYTVRVSLDTDDFADNNVKSFAFRTTPYLQLRQRVVGLAAASLTGQDRGFLYRGAFSVDGQVRPDAAGVEIAVHAHRPYVPGQPAKLSQILYRLPPGAPWWRASNPKEGHWVYNDPMGTAGPVRLLEITQRQGVGNARVADVAFVVYDDRLTELRTAKSYSTYVEVLANRLLLSSVAAGRVTELPPREREPDDEREDEPGWPNPNAN